jgi:hypothetical protein
MQRSARPFSDIQLRSWPTFSSLTRALSLPRTERKSSPKPSATQPSPLSYSVMVTIPMIHSRLRAHNIYAGMCGECTMFDVIFQREDLQKNIYAVSCA